MSSRPQFIGFKEISYTNQRQVSYLGDLASTAPQYVSFLETLNYSQNDSHQRSHFDNIADDLYKKIVKQGYLQRPSKVSRKSKKGDPDVNYYNSNDAFIDDEECCIEKKDKTTVFEDYKSVPVTSLDQLYSDPIYTKRVEDIIVQIGKRKAPEQFSLQEEHDLQKFDAMRKNIKMSILNRGKLETSIAVPEPIQDNKIINQEPPAQDFLDKQPEIINIPAIVEIVQKQEDESVAKEACNEKEK